MVTSFLTIILSEWMREHLQGSIAQANWCARALIDFVTHDQINHCTSRWYPNIIATNAPKTGKKLIDFYGIGYKSRNLFGKKS